MFKQVRSILRESEGIAALEYALIAGLIFAVLIGAVAALGPQISTAFANLGISLTARDLGT